MVLEMARFFLFKYIIGIKILLYQLATSSTELYLLSNYPFRGKQQTLYKAFTSSQLVPTTVFTIPNAKQTRILVTITMPAAFIYGKYKAFSSKVKVEPFLKGLR